MRVIVSGYPGLPRAWRGETCHAARFGGPVAVIGDIHGRADLLGRLLPLLRGRAILVTGDVGDRGPDTRGVLDQLVEHEAIGVMGNHDLWLAAWGAGEGFDRLALSTAMGGRATLSSYGIAPERAEEERRPLPPAHAAWLLGLHVALDLEVRGQRFWVVHGGIPTDIEFVGLGLADVVPTLARERAPDLMWRANDPESMIPLDRPIIMGHVPFSRPRDFGHVIAVDTGAGGADGRLSAVLLPERRFVGVE